MSWKSNSAGEIEDPVVAEALKNFKASMNAWGNAAMSRPRTTVRTVRHTWRLAASWALGCVMAAGSVAGALYERHHQQELARIAAMHVAAQKAAQERAAAGQSAVAIVPAPSAKRQSPAANTSEQDEDLLATVDKDVSREVPAAMEPLAQLMNENGTE
jgi:hypothetical protein